MKHSVFDLIRRFSEFAYNNPDKIRPTHHALYYFLVEMNNKHNWVEWFCCPLYHALQGSSIQSKTTYYKTLEELEKFGFIEVRKGKNINSQAFFKIKSIVSINGTLAVPLDNTLADNLTNTLDGTLDGTLTGTLAGNNIKTIDLRQETIDIINNNKDIVEKNIKKWIDDYKKKNKRFIKPTLEEIKDYCFERQNNVDANKFINFYEANGWKVGRNSMKDWKAAIRTWENNNFNNNTNGKSNSTLSAQEQLDKRKAEITQRNKERFGDFDELQTIF